MVVFEAWWGKTNTVKVGSHSTCILTVCTHWPSEHGKLTIENGVCRGSKNSDNVFKRLVDLGLHLRLQRWEK